MTSTNHQRTRHFNVTLIILAAAGLVVALMAIYPDARASHGRHGWWGHSNDGHAGMSYCETGHITRISEMGPHLQSWLELDDAQSTAWFKVERKIERTVTELSKYCDGTGAATVRDRLERAEMTMTAGAAAIRDLRPAFDQFYESLDERQQAMLDEKVVGGWR